MQQLQRSAIWSQRIAPYLQRAEQPDPLVVAGKLTRMVGLTLEAVGCQAAIGGRCLIESTGGRPIEAEVVGFHEDKLYLMPIGDLQGLGPGARVIPTHSVCEVPVGDNLLGRVLDGAGHPLDDKGPLHVERHVPLTGRQINPLKRTPIHEPLDVGVEGGPAP